MMSCIVTKAIRFKYQKAAQLWEYIVLYCFHQKKPLRQAINHDNIKCYNVYLTTK